MIDAVVNDDSQRATDILHDYISDKAKQIINHDDPLEVEHSNEKG